MENPLQNQGIKGSQPRGNIMQHSASHGGLDKNTTQVTVLGDSPTDYVAAGTRNGDFMGVPKTKVSKEGKKYHKLTRNKIQRTNINPLTFLAILVLTMFSYV